MGSLPLESIAAVVLGGTSLFGGIGGIGGTFIGVLMLTIITNIFNLLGFSSYFQMIGYGFIIILAVFLNKLISPG
ncbi:MAG: hypothetical protein M0Z41_19525 [Peptococcaceae bacterium]|jgi:ribose transport system permease protein|nr:hypothetical protein [Peptococcaceae bacterium]